MSKIEIVYCGDEWKHRAKVDGASLVDQCIRSVSSMRTNWSASIPVLFLHSEALSDDARTRLDSLKVQILQVGPPICDEFPIANKILPSRLRNRGSDMLFLDCDTIVHQMPKMNSDCQILVSFDIIASVPKDFMDWCFSLFGLPVPEGRYVESPAWEYHMADARDIYPMWNSGVFFVRNDIRDIFYEEYLSVFQELHLQMRESEYVHYTEQIAFTVAIHLRGLAYGFLEKGVNFICNARAPYLNEWPSSRIVIEHYAGNTSRPLSFTDGRIDWPQV
jgi:hypothetical protein